MNALHQACVDGDLDTVKEILQNTDDIKTQLGVTGKFGNTAFLLSAKYGHTNIVKFLVAMGANIYDQDDFDRNALILATICGHPNTVEALITFGVTIDAPSINGHTALMEAICSRNDKCSLIMVKCLLKAGANIYARSNFNNTARNYAGNYKNDHAIECLIHAEIIQTTLALTSLNISPYTLLWIFQWAYEIPEKDTLRTLRWIEGVQRSCQKLKVN